LKRSIIEKKESDRMRKYFPKDQSLEQRSKLNKKERQKKIKDLMILLTG
jgi:hypothetical protein